MSRNFGLSHACRIYIPPRRRPPFSELVGDAGAVIMNGLLAMLGGIMFVAVFGAGVVSLGALIRHALGFGP